MISRETADQLDKRLAKLLGVDVETVRSYLDHDYGPRRANGSQITGYRFQRGTHSGHYVRDPQGTDPLPAGYAFSD